GLDVDAGADGLTDPLVLQRLVTGAELVVIGIGDAGVDGDAVEPAAVAVVELDVVGSFECGELVRAETGDEVDLPGADGLDLSVGVRVVAVLDLVELRLTAPEVRVRLECDRLVRFIALELERTGADRLLIVLELPGLVDLRPHVLGHDGDLLARVVRLRLLQGDRAWIRPEPRPCRSSRRGCRWRPPSPPCPSSGCTSTPRPPTSAVRRRTTSCPVGSCTSRPCRRRRCSSRWRAPR